MLLRQLADLPYALLPLDTDRSLSLALGAGLYLKFQGKNQGQAAATLNSSQVNVQSTNLIGYWTFDGADTSSTTATDRGGANS